MEAGIIGVAALVALVCLGVPLAFGIGLVGIAGIGLLVGVPQAATQTFQAAFQTTTQFVLTSIPLFILMGHLVGVGGIGRDLYDCVQKWVNWMPGGLAVTTVVSCAGLGAMTGVSATGIGALGPFALPEMRRHGYDPRLSSGSLASASTLGILIPPSISFIVYGIWTDTSIGQLFAAGIVPGLVMTAAFCAYIVIASLVDPKRAPRGDSYPWSVRFLSLAKILPMILIFTVMIAGLYLGWFTPTEGAAVGCSCVALVLLAMGRLSWAGIVEATLTAAKISIMIFAVFTATQVFSRFLVLTDLARVLVEAISRPELNRYVVLGAILLIYLLLGMILDSIGMMLLTLPFVFPVIVKLGFDPVWFGVILTVMIEVGLLTPPVGMNCYLLHQVAPFISLGEVFRGILPFVGLCLLCVVAFTLWPGIVLWLPRLAF
jgi:tripartite ATP-independent transporter DctM subunit